MRARFVLPAALIVAAACGGEKAASTDTAGVPNPTASTPDSAAAGATAGGTAGGAAGGETAGAAGSLSDASTVAQLDSVNTAAGNDLTTLPVAAAVPLIQSFEGKLNASTDADLKSIGGDLGELREKLNARPVNGREIGEALAELGPKVTRAASKGGAAQATLTSIGQRLTKASIALRGEQKGGAD